MKDGSLAVTNLPVTEGMKGRIEGQHPEPTCECMQTHEAGKDARASRDTGSPEGSLKDRKTLFRHNLFVQVLLAVASSLLAIYAVNKPQLASITEPRPSASPVIVNHGATTSLASFS